MIFPGMYFVVYLHVLSNGEDFSIWMKEKLIVDSKVLIFIYVVFWYLASTRLG